MAQRSGRQAEKVGRQAAAAMATAANKDQMENRKPRVLFNTFKRPCAFIALTKVKYVFCCGHRRGSNTRRCTCCVVVFYFFRF